MLTTNGSEILKSLLPLSTCSVQTKGKLRIKTSGCLGKDGMTVTAPSFCYSSLIIWSS